MTRGISEQRFESLPLITDLVDVLLSRLLVTRYLDDEWCSCAPLGSICATLTWRGLVDGGASVSSTGMTTWQWASRRGARVKREILGGLENSGMKNEQMMMDTTQNMMWAEVS